MFEYFAQLRKLPEPARRKKALLISVLITLLIMVVWGVFLYHRVDNGMFSAGEQKTSAEKDSPGIIATFASFFDGVGGIFKANETYENTAGTYDSQ
jgi:flagellar basal body-associated protein FliL